MLFLLLLLFMLVLIKLLIGFKSPLVFNEWLISSGFGGCFGVVPNSGIDFEFWVSLLLMVCIVLLEAFELTFGGVWGCISFLSVSIFFEIGSFGVFVMFFSYCASFLSGMFADDWFVDEPLSGWGLLLWFVSLLLVSLLIIPSMLFF